MIGDAAGGVGTAGDIAGTLGGVATAPATVNAGVN